MRHHNTSETSLTQSNKLDEMKVTDKLERNLSLYGRGNANIETNQTSSPCLWIWIYFTVTVNKNWFEKKKNDSDACGDCTNGRARLALLPGNKTLIGISDRPIYPLTTTKRDEDKWTSIARERGKRLISDRNFRNHWWKSKIMSCIINVKLNGKEEEEDRIRTRLHKKKSDVHQSAVNWRKTISYCRRYR